MANLCLFIGAFDGVQGEDEIIPSFLQMGKLIGFSNWVLIDWAVLSDEQMSKRWPFSLLYK